MQAFETKGLINACSLRVGYYVLSARDNLDRTNMRLYYHRDSDELFWLDPEYGDHGITEDVTNDSYYRVAAMKRGIATPPNITGDPPIDTSKLLPNNMATAIVKSYKKWERKAADLYPTPVDAVESIMPLIDALDIKTVWEPACGDGRLARVLEYHGIQVFSSDIREYSGYGVGPLDFLNDAYADDVGEIDAIITNPPFSLAREFVEKALEIAPIVIMLVKQNYWNTKGRVGFFRASQPNMFLPVTWRLAFLKEERGNSPLMDCAWCVWIRGNTDHCRLDPIVKKVYPGYADKGVLATLRILEGEIDELTSEIAKLLP